MRSGADAQSKLEDVKRKIARLVDLLEGESKPDPDIAERLAARRTERRELEDRLTAAQALAHEQPVEPTMDWVHEQVRQLAGTLTDPTPAAAYALRDLLDGPIRVRQIERAGKKRHFLRGTLRIRLGTLVSAMGVRSTDGMDAADSPYEEITIDFVRENPLDARSNEVKALWDENLPNKEIARRLNCKPSMVTKLLKHWSLLHGVALPDGRSRRGKLPISPDALPLYRRISESVMELYHQHVELGDIAAKLGHDRDTVTAAVRYWHESRGLPVPDGRTRRKSLPRSTENQKDVQ